MFDFPDPIASPSARPAQNSDPPQFGSRSAHRIFPHRPAMLAPCKGPAITIWSFQVRIPLSVCWCLAAWLSCPFLPLVHSQDDIRELKLKDWQPRSMLVTRQSVVETPRFPVIDIHNHLGGGAEYLTEERVARYLAEMDSAGVRTVINLDGGSGQRLRETLEALDKKHPGRFLTFAQIDFTGLDDEGWSNREVERLRDSFEQGARGLKFQIGRAHV